MQPSRVEKADNYTGKGSEVGMGLEPMAAASPSVGSTRKGAD